MNTKAAICGLMDGDAAYSCCLSVAIAFTAAIVAMWAAARITISIETEVEDKSLFTEKP